MSGSGEVTVERVGGNFIAQKRVRSQSIFRRDPFSAQPDRAGVAVRPGESAWNSPTVTASTITSKACLHMLRGNSA
ncbi:hypothetical protein ABBQ32_011748 [Trebouxia sp. C0010 RCD-2024]